MMGKESSSEHDILTTEEACKLLKISKPTLYKLIEKKKISGYKIGKEYRFNKQELMSYIGGSQSTRQQRVSDIQPKADNETGYQWELKDDFATVGIQKMAKRTFQAFSSNLEELIVNAYDEDATEVKIIVDKNKKILSVIDDGNGMDKEDLSNYVIYGESNKDDNYRSIKFQRPAIGEYGMGGKLAISNLCRECIIITKKGGHEHQFKMGSKLLESAKYISEVKRTVLTKKCSSNMHGTIIHMSGLHYKRVDADRLNERLAMKMPKSQNFKILLITRWNGNEETIEIKEPTFEHERKFDFKEKLSLIGDVDMTIYYTKMPLSVSKQGIWTKVNGRIVNEKQEWFGLLNLTSGHRYKYRIYGIGNADGLKSYITFAKNDFIDCPEYREYCDFVNSSLRVVQDTLLKADEDARRKSERETIKKVEDYINKVVTKFGTPDMMKKFASKLKKVFTENIEDAPIKPFPELEKAEEEINKEIERLFKRGEDKQKRRYQSIESAEKLTYSGKGFNIETVDMSNEGDLIVFREDESIIEINEKHPLYTTASKRGYLDSFVRDLAFMEIARDYCGGNLSVFDSYYNELAKIAAAMKL